LSIISYTVKPVSFKERYIKELKNENKIEFRGASKTDGYYSLP
jgi:hypothetical protein